jgi:TolB-like protein
MREQDGAPANGMLHAGKPGAEAVRAQLQKILSSPGFAASERPSRFLSYIVEQALEGHHLKETVLGVEVFGRKPTYDPRLDGVVRVEAVKLRARLKEYYQGEGRQDPIRIDLPKGGYLPSFEAVEPAEPRAGARVWWRDWRVVIPPTALVILIAGYLLAKAPHRVHGSAPSSSIAVLPFVNLSSDRENEYFSDGLTDDLIDALTKVQGLRVVARGSVFQFKGKNPDIRTVGRQLGVAAVLEGSVQKSGDRLRITAQLSSVADGYHLWSQTYDRKLRDVFAVQDEISRAIVDALEVRVAAQPARKPPASPNLEAYNLYLQGRFHLNKWRPEEARKGIEYFQQAIAKDPHYAAAYAGLADCHTWLAVFGWAPAEEAMPQARDAANRALQLDDTLAAAHISLGYVKALYDWDWPGADREFQGALALNPGDPDAHFAYALSYLAPLGRLDEALAEAERARELDPLSAYKVTGVGMVYTYRREYGRAIQQCKKALELEPAFFQAADEISRVSFVSGKSVDGAEALRMMGSLVVPHNDTAMRVQAYAREGKARQARALIEAWTRECVRAHRPSVSCGAAEMYASIGDRDRALEWLDKAYAERNPLLAYAKVLPTYDSLRSDPRFTSMLKRLGLAN